MIKRLAFALALLLCPAPALATTITNPHVYTNGETLTAANLNAPLSVLFAWADGNVDFSNIGTGGIYASQIKPGTSAQATFTAGVGFVFTSTTTGVVPLTVTPYVGSAANALVVNTSSGVPGVTIDSVGDISTTASMVATGSITATGGANLGSGNSSAGNLALSGSLQVNGGTIYTNSAGTHYIQDAGSQFVFSQPVNVTGLITTSGSPVPYLVNASGSNPGGNPHTLITACTPASTYFCTATLSGAAAFTGGGTWSCSASVVANQIPAYAYISSGGTVVGAAYNDGGSRSATINIACTGY